MSKPPCFNITLEDDTPIDENLQSLRAWLSNNVNMLPIQVSRYRRYCQANTVGMTILLYKLHVKRARQQKIISANTPSPSPSDTPP